MQGKSVSVIIPTLNAQDNIGTLLDKLQTQTYPIKEIVIVDSESADKTIEICSLYPKVRIIYIKKSEFDHGKTRDIAIRTCDTDYVLFMTQDAIPYDNECVQKLLEPLSEEKIIIATGRQLARQDATPMEKLIRKFNYPNYSNVRSKDDLDKMGIKTYFFSDVFAAYNREKYLELGGFEYPLKTNEDMFFAAKVIRKGYKIAYVADAKVIHSHNFTLKQQYKRNYIQGYEIEKHKDLLANVSQNSEGIKLVKYVSINLLKKGRVLSFIHFSFDCIARFSGNRVGKRKAKINENYEQSNL